MYDMEFENAWFKTVDFEPEEGIRECLKENIQRVTSVVTFLPKFVGIAMRYQLAHTKAIYQHKNRLELTDEERKDADLMAIINSDQNDIVAESEREEIGRPDRIGAFLRKNAANTLAIMKRYDYHAEVEFLIINMILGTWTAFEVFATDLWVAAINNGPSSLAEEVFAGAQKQPLKPEMDGVQKRETMSEEKTIRLSVLKNYGYDLRGKMGNLLKDEGKVRFDSFANTIRAYEVAFGSGVLKILNKADKECGNIAFLEAARNALVHRGGLADSKFREKVGYAIGSSYHHLKALGDAEKIPIRGGMVKELAESTMSTSLRLIKFVDSRIGGGNVISDGH